MEECEYRYKEEVSFFGGEEIVTKCYASDGGPAIVNPEIHCEDCKIREMDIFCQNMQPIRVFAIGGGTDTYGIRCNSRSGAFIDPDKDCIDCEFKI